jgi:hypothetical protein
MLKMKATINELLLRKLYALGVYSGVEASVGNVRESELPV